LQGLEKDRHFFSFPIEQHGGNGLSFFTAVLLRAALVLLTVLLVALSLTILKKKYEKGKQESQRFF